MRSLHSRYMIPLGAISIIGPFSVDMYLPNFPAIASEFHVSNAAVQLTMVSYALANAAGQLIYGPTADMFGRKPPLFAGLALYCLASFGCAMSVNIQMLIVMRFLQGLGACGSMVISRAMVRDVFRGPDAVKMMSLILLMISVSPILAPLAGSTVTLFLSWRWVFGVLTVLAIGSAAISAWLLPETVSADQRAAVQVKSFFIAYVKLAGEGRFLAMAAILGLASGVMWAYLSGASLLFIQTYHVAPMTFSIIFACNAIGLIGTAQYTSTLVRRFGAGKVVIAGCLIAGAFQAPLAILFHLTVPPLIMVIPMMLAGFAAMGLIMAPTTMLAMESQKEGLGSAAALLGTLQFGFSALASWAVGATAGSSEAGMFTVMAGCSVSALVIALLVLRRPRVDNPAPSHP